MPPSHGDTLARVSTIAANRNEMAADSQSTAGSTKSRTPRPKFQRINGDLVAAVGSTDIIPRFFEWYKKGRPEDDKPDLGDSFEALVLTPEGLFQYYKSLDRSGSSRTSMLWGRAVRSRLGPWQPEPPRSGPSR